jgi:hypothetical protein
MDAGKPVWGKRESGLPARPEELGEAGEQLEISLHLV